MRKSDNDVRAFDNAVKRIKHFRERELTRRQVLKASAATALGATLASQFVPKEVHADVGGTIVHFASSGKRLANSLRAVKPLFDKVYPNVTLEVVSKPMSEALTQINTYMRSKSDSFDVVTQDHAQFASLDAMGALTDLGPYLEPFPDWLADYREDVPEAYRHMWNLPKGPAPPGYIAALAPDGNAMMTFYRKDVFDGAGIPVPQTWDDVIDACKEIHDPANERYAYCAAMARNFWAGYQYYGSLRSMGGDVFADEVNQDWTVAINTEEGYQALKVLVDLQQYAHPVSANAGEDEVNLVFAQGTALYSPLTWGTAVLNDPTYTGPARALAHGPLAERHRAQGRASCAHRRLRPVHADLGRQPGDRVRLDQVPQLGRPRGSRRQSRDRGCDRGRRRPALAAFHAQPLVRPQPSSSA